VVRRRCAAARAAEEAADEQNVAETRRVLLDLADVWSAYVAETANFAKKLRVQALVAALPGNYAKEIGYAVDLPRDCWGPDQWPLENFVQDRNDKIVAKNAPIIELIWNLLDVQLNRAAHTRRSARPRDWIRVERAVYGYLDLVHRREQNNRELVESPTIASTASRSRPTFGD
jgi:hypothetical protein